MGVSALGTVAVADKTVSKHQFWNTTLFLLHGFTAHKLKYEVILHADFQLATF